MQATYEIIWVIQLKKMIYLIETYIWLSNMNYIFKCPMQLLKRNIMLEDSTLGFFLVRDVISSNELLPCNLQAVLCHGGIPLPTIMTIPKLE